jgi:hypothetical protein
MDVHTVALLKRMVGIGLGVTFTDVVGKDSASWPMPHWRTAFAGKRAWSIASVANPRPGRSWVSQLPHLWKEHGIGPDTRRSQR